MSQFFTSVGQNIYIRAIFIIVRIYWRSYPFNKKRKEIRNKKDIFISEWYDFVYRISPKYLDKRVKHNKHNLYRIANCSFLNVIPNFIA